MKLADVFMQARPLSVNIVVLLVSVAISVVAMRAVSEQRTNLQAQLGLASAQHAEQSARIEHARTEEREFRKHTDLYREIVDRGLVQPERRLDWVALLNRIKAQRRLLDFQYELAPQRPFEPGPAATADDSFRVSRMRFDMPMLHENDLLGVLSDLAAQPGVIVSPRHCIIERVPDSRPVSPATLKAWCELDWITVREES